MSDKSKSVFLIGPGFIGWNVLDLLVSEGYKVTTLVRRKEHGAQIQKLSGGDVQIVYGSLDDWDLIVRHVEGSEITFHTATADHLPSAKAVLEGVRKRAAEGKGTIYSTPPFTLITNAKLHLRSIPSNKSLVHTSGTSVLDDKSHGAFKGDKIYSDDDPDAINALSDDAPHRPIDLTIVRAQKELGEKAKMVIMTPPEIYGFNPAHKRLTIQFPFIARFALKHGYAGYVGKGLAVESQVHVLDLARAYIVLLHHLESAPASEFLANPYFFCENGKEFSWLEAATEIGKSLHAAGQIKDATPRQFPEEAYEELFGSDTAAVIGLNSRSRAVRLRKLGWEAREKSIWESWNEDELPQLLKDEGRAQST